MAITSLKPIKAKNKREVIGKRNPGSSKHVGFTDSEARGIFGKYHEYTKEERRRIAEYRARKAQKEKERTQERDALKSGDVLKYYKEAHADVKTRMAERQRKAWEKLSLMPAYDG